MHIVAMTELVTACLAASLVAGYVYIQLALFTSSLSMSVNLHSDMSSA